MSDIKIMLLGLALILFSITWTLCEYVGGWFIALLGVAYAAWGAFKKK